MNYRVWLSLLIIGLLTSCSEVKCPNNVSREAELRHYRELLKILETPQYSQAVEITGIASFGPEMVEIGLCPFGKETCDMPINVDGTFQPCWLVFRSNAEKDLEGMGIVKRIEDGSYRVRGLGRIATQPGLFGHLSSYTCQVELESITSFKPTRHWLAPPPL